MTDYVKAGEAEQGQGRESEGSRGGLLLLAGKARREAQLSR